jgi:hypothetical protein
MTLDNITAVLAHVMDKNYTAEDAYDTEFKIKTNMLLNLIDESYVLVMWPDSQDFMEADWFRDEAVLHDDSSYFIPIRRLLE